MTLTASQNGLEFSSSGPLSPTSHLERKMKKPLMEKRRRARINQCLSELKSLLLDAVPTVSTAAGTAHPTKLEKADILEMTVRHLKARKAQQNSNDLILARQTFAEGYSTCFQAVMDFLSTSTVPIDPRMRFGLMAHMTRAQETNPTPTLSMSNGNFQRRPDLTINIPRGQRAAQQLPTPPFRKHLGSTGSDASETSGTLSPTSSLGSFSPTTPSSGAPWRPW